MDPIDADIARRAIQFALAAKEVVRYDFGGCKGLLLKQRGSSLELSVLCSSDYGSADFLGDMKKRGMKAPPWEQKYWIGIPLGRAPENPKMVTDIMERNVNPVLQIMQEKVGLVTNKL
jgi:hypothetical protein